MNKLFYIVMILPVLAFAVGAIMMGIPQQTIVSKETFVFQYAMTMLTILAIPALLWYIRKERFGDDKKYGAMAMFRLVFFGIMVLIDLVAYFAIPNVTFFYLAVITYLSIFFARR